jgi:hypothetical protein
MVGALCFSPLFPPYRIIYIYTCLWNGFNSSTTLLPYISLGLDWIVGAKTNTNPAMESSRGKLSAAGVLLLMTLLMVAAMRAVEARDCLTQSTRLPGHLCVRSDYCAIGCRAEGKGYTGGRCLISPIPLDGILCYCVKPCPSTTTD